MAFSSLYYTDLQLPNLNADNTTYGVILNNYVQGLETKLHNLLTRINAAGVGDSSTLATTNASISSANTKANSVLPDPYSGNYTTQSSWPSYNTELVALGVTIPQTSAEILAFFEIPSGGTTSPMEDLKNFLDAKLDALDTAVSSIEAEILDAQQDTCATKTILDALTIYRSGGTTVTVTAENADEFSPPYVQGSYNSSHSRYEWSQSGNSTTYYQAPTGELQQNTGGTAPYSVTLSISTVNDFSPIYQNTGTFSDTRSGMDSHTFTVYNRNSTNYYYTTINNSNLGVSAGSFYTRGGGGSTGGNYVQQISYNASTYYWRWQKDAAYNGTVSNTSGASDYYVTLNSSYGGDFESVTLSGFSNGEWTDPRVDASTQTFNTFRISGGSTIFYAPQNDVTINGVSLVANRFYTQSGGSGSSGQNLSNDNYDSSHYWRWSRNAAYNGLVSANSTSSGYYTTLNTIYGGNFSAVSGGSGWFHDRYNVSTQTFNKYTDGTTTFYAPTATTSINNKTLNKDQFYTQSAESSYQVSLNTKWSWVRDVLTTVSYTNGSSFPDQNQATSGYWYVWSNTQNSSFSDRSLYIRIQIPLTSGGTSAFYMRIYYPFSNSGYYKINYQGGSVDSLTYVRSDGTVKSLSGGDFGYDYVQNLNDVVYVYGSTTISGTSYSFLIEKGSQVSYSPRTDGDLWYFSFSQYDSDGTLTIRDAGTNAVLLTKSNVSVTTTSVTENATASTPAYTHNRNDSVTDLSSVTPSGASYSSPGNIKSYAVVGSGSSHPTRSYTQYNDYTYSDYNFTGSTDLGRTSFVWNGSEVFSENDVTYASATTSTTVVSGNTYTYAQTGTIQIDQTDLKEFTINQSYTSTTEDYTYSAYNYVYTPTTGKVTIVWNGSQIGSTITGQTFAQATTSVTRTESGVSVTYARDGSNKLTGVDDQKFSVKRSYTENLVYQPYTYTLHTNTQSFPATYTYADVTDQIVSKELTLLESDTATLTYTQIPTDIGSGINESVFSISASDYGVIQDLLDNSILVANSFASFWGRQGSSRALTASVVGDISYLLSPTYAGEDRSLTNAADVQVKYTGPATVDSTSRLTVRMPYVNGVTNYYGKTIGDNDVLYYYQYKTRYPLPTINCSNPSPPYFI